MPIRFINDDAIQKKDRFIYPEEYERHLDYVIISNEEIVSRTTEIAAEIKKKYLESCRNLELICVLNGSCIFFHYLLTALARERVRFGFDFIKVKSYEGVSTTGNVAIKELSNLAEKLKGKDVIVVEDIVDTGTTLNNLLPKIESDYGPRCVEVCTLLNKRIGEKKDVSIAYSGFSIPDKFVVGFGLDYNETFRDLLDIWVLTKEGVEKQGLIA